jgi:hypothetical protein
MPTLVDFKNNFFGGSRANRFYIEGYIPAFGDISSTQAFTKFHVRATQIPALTTKTLSYDYFGRKYHYPGEKDYGTWSFTVLDDYTDSGDNNLWKKFNTWQNGINNHDTNISFIPTLKTNVASANSDPAQYKAINWRIHHLPINGETSSPLKTFVMHGCWPQSVAPIAFNMNTPSALNMFSVTMVYDYIELLANDQAITKS